MSLVAILRPLSRALANSGCEPMLMISPAVSTRGPVSFAPFFSSTTELDVHRRLDAGPGRLAVGLEGMAVTHEEQPAWVVDRQVDGRSLADLVVIEVAAVGPRRPRGRREVARRRHADAAEHRPRGELERMGLTLRRPEPDSVRLAVDVPGHDRLAPLDDKVRVDIVRIDVLDHLWRQRERGRAGRRTSPSRG